MNIFRPAPATPKWIYLVTFCFIRFFFTPDDAWWKNVYVSYPHHSVPSRILVDFSLSWSAIALQWQRDSFQLPKRSFSHNHIPLRERDKWQQSRNNVKFTCSLNPRHGIQRVLLIRRNALSSPKLCMITLNKTIQVFELLLIGEKLILRSCRLGSFSRWELFKADCSFRVAWETPSCTHDISTRKSLHAEGWFQFYASQCLSMRYEDWNASPGYDHKTELRRWQERFWPTKDSSRAMKCGADCTTILSLLTPNLIHIQETRAEYESTSNNFLRDESLAWARSRSVPLSFRYCARKVKRNFNISSWEARLSFARFHSHWLHWKLN